MSNDHNVLSRITMKCHISNVNEWGKKIDAFH